MGYYSDNQKEYASKGVANTGLGISIAALATSLLNGGFGNVLGLGNCGNFGRNGNAVAGVALAESQLISSLQAENSALKAERYSDNVSREVYQQSLRDNQALKDELFTFIRPLSEEAGNNRVTIAKLEAEQKCYEEKSKLREEILVGKIKEVALASQNRFESLDSTINCLSKSVNSNTSLLNSLTKTVIPKDVICPEVMDRYNSWVAPTNTPATATVKG